MCANNWSCPEVSLSRLPDTTELPVVHSAHRKTESRGHQCSSASPLNGGGTNSDETNRREHPAQVATEIRTETVYITENGTGVRRVVTVDSSGRRYYVQNGRTIYVDHYEY
jgi:hypothetical protein